MLWRAISLSKQRPHIFETWLNRSSHCPLSFDLDDWDASSKVFASANLHHARWQYLILTAYLPPQLDGPMPLLRRLDLSVEHESDTVALRGVPLLRTVIFNGLAASSVTLPWAQLTSLTLKSVYPRDCVPVLQKTSDLLHCELNLCPDEDDELPFSDIRLLRLESLVLNQLGTEAVTGYLQTLTAPALRSLQVPERFLDPNPIDSLSTFLSKSGCNLESVDITDTESVDINDTESVDIADTISILEESYRGAFPSIQNLLLNGRSCNPNTQ
ncbi:hypothetical protein B0H19DRAFT_96535 [Mycena capillaripes]|nr:hypothetical protein B0H19DRAFT_96535 [Mycena capillaripes]